jgi:uncharacterized protein (DUF3084 family)
MRTPVLLAGLAVLAAVSAASAASQTDDDRLRDQLRSTVTQLRELQDSQATLMAQKAAAEQERDALKKKVGSRSAGTAVARRDAAVIAGLRADLAKAQADNAQLAAGAQATGAELAKTKQLLAQATAQGQALAADRDGLKATLATCAAHNAQLYKTGREILDAYARVDLTTVMAKKEPFLGLKRVQLENLAQDYRDALEDGVFTPNQQRVPPGARKPPTGR